MPIIPIVCSSTNHLRLNRWNNGHVIVEMLPPVSTEGLTREQVRELSKQCHHDMQIKLAELDAEVARLDAQPARG